MKSTTTQVVARPVGRGRPGEEQHERSASRVPERMRNGRRRPPGLVERSLIRPAIGFRMTSQALGRKTTRPATAGGHAEPVGEVGQQQQAGHGAERAGRHRARARSRAGPPG